MNIPPGTPHEHREVVITFNDLSETGRPMGPLPVKYAGFTWSESAWFMTREFSQSLRSVEPITLFNAHGEDLFFEREELFILKGLVLFALWDDSTTVLIEGWQQGRNRYTERIVLKRNMFSRPGLDYTNIDRVGLTAAGGAHFAIQSITIAEEV